MIEQLRSQFQSDLRNAKDQLEAAEAQVENLNNSVKYLLGAIAALNQLESAQKAQPAPDAA